MNGVLGILSEEEAEDVAAIDIDDVMARFSNLQGSKFTPESLQTYRSRVKSSIEDFLRYLDNPLTFRVAKGSASRKAREREKAPDHRSSEAKDKPNDRQDNRLRSDDTILPIPIRADLMVYVQGLPFDLTRSEANKIANVVRAMVIEDQE